MEKRFLLYFRDIEMFKGRKSLKSENLEVRKLGVGKARSRKAGSRKKLDAKS